MRAVAPSHRLTHAAELARDVRERLAAFQPAGAGARHERCTLHVRGDSTLWLDPPGASEPQQRRASQRFEALRLALNRDAAARPVRLRVPLRALPAGRVLPAASGPFRSDVGSLATIGARCPACCT